MNMGGRQQQEAKRWCLLKGRAPSSSPAAREGQDRGAGGRAGGCSGDVCPGAVSGLSHAVGNLTSAKQPRGWGTRDLGSITSFALQLLKLPYGFISTREAGTKPHAADGRHGGSQGMRAARAYDPGKLSGILPLLRAACPGQGSLQTLSFLPCRDLRMCKSSGGGCSVTGSWWEQPQSTGNGTENRATSQAFPQPEDGGIGPVRGKFQDFISCQVAALRFPVLQQAADTAAICCCW